MRDRDFDTIFQHYADQRQTVETAGAPRFRPHGLRLLVRPIPEPTVSQSGLVIALTAEKPKRGVVVAAGPGEWRHGAFVTQPFTAGAEVLFGKYAGQTVELAGEELLMLSVDDIFGVFE